MNPLARWMKTATTAEQNRLAKAAKTTIGTLRQIAGEYRETNVTAALAARIDRETLRLDSINPIKVHLVRKHGSPVPRESLCPACKACEFAKQCRS